MEEIYNKLHELWELLKETPEDCKGSGEEPLNNAQIWLYIRSKIHAIIDNLEPMFGIK